MARGGTFAGSERGDVEEIPRVRRAAEMEQVFELRGFGKSCAVDVNRARVMLAAFCAA